MKKTLALLALAGLFALTSVVFGSPPTVKKETVEKPEYVKIVKTAATADTSAVVPSDAEARTCEAANVETLNAVAPTYTPAADRRGVNPPGRLHSGGAGIRRNVQTDFKYNREASGAVGYVLRL